MNDKVKKLRVELNITVHGNSNKVEFFRATASQVDKQSGTKRIITSAEASNMRHAIYWGKQNALGALGKQADEVQFLVRRPEKEEPVKAEAKPVAKPEVKAAPVGVTSTKPADTMTVKSVGVPPPPSASQPNRVN